MFCRKCGKEILEESIFCSYCGEKVIIDKESRENEKNNSLKFILVSIIIVALIFGSVIIISKWMDTNNRYNKETEEIEKNEENETESQHENTENNNAQEEEREERKIEITEEIRYDSSTGEIIKRSLMKVNKKEELICMEDINSKAEIVWKETETGSKGYIDKIITPEGNIELGEIYLYGEIILDKNGCVKKHLWYDIETGRKESEIRYKYEDNKRIEVHNIIYNNDGSIISENTTSYYKNGKMKERSSISYDNGVEYRVIKQYYNENEDLIREEENNKIDGISTITEYVCEYQFDKEGKIINARKSIKGTKEIIESIKYEYDENGNRISANTYDSQGELVIMKKWEYKEDGYTMYIYQGGGLEIEYRYTYFKEEN